MLDAVIKGGTVVDGTGAPRRQADVGVRDGLIVEIGKISEAATNVIDADGMVVAPGFIDVHTHYDAQLLWDPTASPSSIHGVTTVFGGNCGFALAPAGPEHADYLMTMLARVEGIPIDALRSALDWDWKSFADYAAHFDGNIAVNAGFMAGHSTIRRSVMGEDAVGHPATEDQIVAMEQLLHQALSEGAIGFSSSQSHTHNDGDGDPVPSRAASREEMVRLASVLRDHAGTQIELILSGCINGFSDADISLMSAMSAGADRPLNWNVLTVGGTGASAEHQLSAYDRAAEQGGRIYALTLPIAMGLRLSFLTGFVFDGLPGWAETMALPISERIKAFSDPTVRAHLRERAASDTAGGLRMMANWPTMRITDTFAPENARYAGRLVSDIAAEMGKDPFDALMDIVVADRLRTGMEPAPRVETEEMWRERAAIWQDPRTIVGASDAGAHLDLMCNSGYTTFLVGDAVHRGLIDLEEAVRQLTDVPGRIYGVKGRGRLAEGWHADVVVFDPQGVGATPAAMQADLPAGESRVFAGARGVEHVFVNGTEILRGGTSTGATPGTVMRSGRDLETVSATA